MTHTAQTHLIRAIECTTKLISNVYLCSCGQIWCFFSLDGPKRRVAYGDGLLLAAVGAGFDMVAATGERTGPFREGCSWFFQITPNQAK